MTRPFVQLWVSVGDCCDDDTIQEQVGDSIEVIDHRSIQFAASEAENLKARRDLRCIEVHLVDGQRTEVVHRWGRTGAGWERLDVKCPEARLG